jgi:uncharacterized DUF497 family protein
VSPSEADEVFFNNPLLISSDDKHRESERRYLALGKTNQARALTGVFTLRQDATLIRILSARDQHRKERHFYEQAKQQKQALAQVPVGSQGA